MGHGAAGIPGDGGAPKRFEDCQHGANEHEEVVAPDFAAPARSGFRTEPAQEEEEDGQQIKNGRLGVLSSQTQAADSACTG